MAVFLLTLALVALGVFGMCFNIIFRKDGKFPETEVSKNENMRKLGIKCMKEQEDEMFAARRKASTQTGCTGEYSDACTGCSFYTKTH